MTLLNAQRSTRPRMGVIFAAWIVLLLFETTGSLQGQTATTSVAPESTLTDKSATIPTAPKKVDVQPSAQDDQIARRLEQILVATGWFQEPRVRVQEGVVFLDGTAINSEYKKWAGDLVHNTQDVVAVVNKLEVSRPTSIDLKPAMDGVRGLWRSTVENLPFLAIGGGILLTTLAAMRVAQRGTEHLLKRRSTIPLIRDLIARAVGILVFLTGLYLVLKVSGTTQLALTVLGGTGLFGLVLGIAFRDITENFLASIFLSMQRPFQIGDLVEIVDVTGYVDRLTIRTTIVVTLDGNYVQIPNATVYKNTIRNFTNNPKRRDDFAVYIAYDKDVSKVQDAVMKVLQEHPVVLKQPEPWVLIDRLESGAIHFRIYYWIDCLKNNWLTVRSSVIRLTLHALRDAGVLSLPGPSSIVFPKGIPVQLTRHELVTTAENGNLQNLTEDADSPKVSTKAEGKLGSAHKQLKAQVQEARPLDVGPDLLSEKSKA